jgi:multidrug efflux pump subunit AcrA (membrane-fusion protein)
VETSAARLGTIQASSQATAMFKGWRDITLTAEISGILTKVNVDDGARVKQGQLLAELDHTQLDANVASTQAQLDGARAQLAQAKTATRPQQLAQAEAALSQAQAALDLAKKNFQRQLELFKADVISKAALDAAETQQKQAQGAFDAAQQALSLAHEGARAEDIQSAEAVVHGLEAALTIAKDTQRKAFIKAPFAGRVSKVFPKQHEMVAAGTPVLGLVDDSVMELTVGVAGDIIAKLAVGAPASVHVEALTSDVKGKVSALGIKGDDVSGTFPVKLAVANPEARLLSGMVGTVTLPLATRTNVIVLPRDVVQFMKDGTNVMLAESSGGKTVARSRKVELGLDAGKYVEIKSGLAVGDTVIVTGMKSVFDGDEVNVTATKEMQLPEPDGKQ